MDTLRRFKPHTQLGLFFLLLTISLVVAYVVVYVGEVRQALAMDPNSYNCTEDGMMKQVCADPYGSSIFWSIFGVAVYCWPLIAMWVITGLTLLIRRVIAGARERHS